MYLPRDDLKEVLNSVFENAAQPLLRRGIRLAEGLPLPFIGIWIEDGIVKLRVNGVYPDGAGISGRKAEQELKTLLTELGVPYQVDASGVKRGLFGLVDKLRGRPRIYELSQNDLDERLASLEQPKVSALYKHYALINEIKAVAMAAEAQGGHYEARKWAMGFAGSSTVVGNYFLTTQLEQLADPKSFFNAVNGEGYHVISQSLRNPGLRMETIAKIQDLGFRRLEFLGNGSSTYAFKGIEDKEGRGQLVLITPGDEAYIPHPAILPAIAVELVEHEGRKLFVRVMPELDTRNITDEHVEQLIELIERSELKALLGGKGKDIRKDNVGLYSYIDEGGDKKTVPMILDWGSVLWPGEEKNGEKPPSPAELQEFLDRWAQMPELEPWREAQRHIATKKVENVYTSKQLNALDDLTAAHARKSGGLLTVAIQNKGLSPAELGDLSEKACGQALRGEGDFYKLLGTFVQAYDISQSPDKSRSR